MTAREDDKYVVRKLLAMRKEIIIATKYKIIRKIGHGAFGELLYSESKNRQYGSHQS